MRITVVKVKIKQILITKDKAKIHIVYVCVCVKEKIRVNNQLFETLYRKTPLRNVFIFQPYNIKTLFTAQILIKFL